MPLILLFLFSWPKIPFADSDDALRKSIGLFFKKAGSPYFSLEQHLLPQAVQLSLCPKYIRKYVFLFCIKFCMLNILFYAHFLLFFPLFRPPLYYSRIDTALGRVPPKVTKTTTETNAMHEDNIDSSIPIQNVMNIDE